MPPKIEMRLDLLVIRKSLTSEIVLQNPSSFSNVQFSLHGGRVFCKSVNERSSSNGAWADTTIVEYFMLRQQEENNYQCKSNQFLRMFYGPESK